MDEFIAQFQLNFIDENRWLRLVRGLGITLEVTFFALILGVVLGFLVAIVRSTYEQSPRKKTPSDYLLRFFNAVCKIYITIIRGTPTTIQLLIMYFVVFQSVKIDKVLVAVIAFGLNSGGYVAEIMRSGIMSLDKGQMEAGRSLGLNYVQTMQHIVLPQAFKNVLPALVNEFIVLLKETSIAGLIALQELTYQGNLIRSQTYSAFMPLIAVALIYLGVVMLLSFGLSKLERRLRRSDR